MYEAKKEKRSSIWDSILLFTEEAKIYLLYIFCRKSFLQQNPKYLKKARKAKSGKKEKKKLSKTLIVLVCVHWWVSDAFPLTFLLKLSTDVCSLLFHRCLLLTSCNWPRLQTNLQHVENWSRDRNRSHREKQTEIEIEIEARNWNWNRNRSWLKTEIEIETEIDYWNRDRNRDRLLKTSPEWKSTSEPKRLFEVDFESGFTDLWCIPIDCFNQCDTFGLRYYYRTTWYLVNVNLQIHGQECEIWS